MTGVQINSCRVGPWINLFIFLTNWCVWAVNLTAIIGQILSYNPSLTQSHAINLHSLHHLFYTLSLFLSPVVVLVYWIIVFPKHKGEMWIETEEIMVDGKALTHEQRLDVYQMKLNHTYIVHTLPAACTVILMIVNDCVLIKRHSIFLIFFCLFYAASNFYSVVYLRDGKPLYWFLTWQDHWSLVITALVAITFSSLFYLTAALDEYVTGRKSGK